MDAMKDKLVKILMNVPRPDFIVSGMRVGKTLLTAERVADHLLAEGVIVPPVKLGSNFKVYIPIKDTTTVLETKVFGIGVDEDGDMVINPSVYSTETIEINGYNIGKTVFLTREEAERSLEERK